MGDQLLQPDGTLEKPPRILVVEDERTAREILVLTFSLAGFAVDSARDGHDALQAVDRLDPEVVVTDLHMPRMDGDVLAEQLRQRYGSKGPEIVVATADHERASRLREEGRFFAVLSKPLDPKVLVRTVREAVDARRCA